MTQIIEGRYYRTRDGRKAGPVAKNPSATSYPWYGMLGGNRETWTDKGACLQGQGPHPYDLVAEWAEPVPAGEIPIPMKPFEPPVTKRSLLEAAMAATADRGLNYGAPEDNFRRIADLWNVYLTGRAQPMAPITPADQALMMVLMKVARLQNTPDHLDSWVDLAGYAACGAEVACNAEPGQ